jgi:hypothetical protein
MLQPISCRGLTFSESCLLEEYYFLFGISALLRPRLILEIGGNMGLGSLALFSGAHSANRRPVHVTTIEINPHCKPYIIDNWNSQHAPISSLRIVIGDSREVLPELKKEGLHYGLCFLDGDHSYESARSDWDNTQEMTGIWLLHDSTQKPGVRKLVSEIRETGKYDIFEFDEYPFGTYWNQRANGYGPKNSIPGITIVRRHGYKPELTAEEKTYVDKMLKVQA